MEVIIAIKNKLDIKSPYRSDIFSLFGTEDGMSTGRIGAKTGGEFESLYWDWNMNGFKKICRFLYWNDRKTLEGFENWYKESSEKGHKVVNKFLTNFLYFFNYNRAKISAFVANVKKIEKKEGKLWFEFVPEKYLLLPPEFMSDYWTEFFTQGREDPKKWRLYYEKNEFPLEIGDDFEKVFERTMTQDLYYVVPLDFLENWIEEKASPEEYTKPVFIATIEDNKKLIEKNLNTNNQIFWSIFSQYIGRSQVKGHFWIVEKNRNYRITDVAVNSLSEKSYVYNQEVGTPYVLYQVLTDVYRDIEEGGGPQNKFLDIEFVSRDRSDISINESRFLIRASKVKDSVSNYDGKFADCDYDYVLNLGLLDNNKKILFDLTSGLWNKYVGRPRAEYVEQWLHNIVTVPKLNDNVITVWHYGLELLEPYLGTEIGEYLIKNGGLEEDEFLYLKKNTPIKVPVNLKAVFLPFYDNQESYYGFKKELNDLDPGCLDTRIHRTVLYKSCKELIKFLINQ